MTARRLENGSLRADSYGLTFDLDENGSPVDCSAHDRTDANTLVEEVT
jgi:exoribonuclease R